MQAAVEVGIDIDDGSTLLRLASKVDSIIESLDNDKQKVGVGAEISREALNHLLNLISKKMIVLTAVLSVNMAYLLVDGCGLPVYKI